MSHNLSLKLIALALAITTWGFTRIADPTEEWQMAFDLDIRLSEGYSLVSRSPNDKTIKAYVTGQVSRLERVQTTNPKVVLDGRNLQPGEPTMVNLRLDRRYPGIHMALTPGEILVVVDATASSTYMPEEVSEGHLPVGYYIDSRSGLPDGVTVTGAKSLMDRVSNVVYHLNMSALTGSTEATVEFSPVDETGNEIANLTVNPKSANIAIGLQPSQALKTVPIVVDYQGNPASNYALTSLSSDPFLVEVAGPAEFLSDIVSVRTEPIDLTGKTASFEQHIALIVPNQNVSLSTTRADVSVVIAQIDTTHTFEDILVELRGTDPNLDYALDSERVNVTIRGSLEGISGATSDEIRPSIDLTGLTEGTHDLRISVDLPSGVRLDNATPSIIKVTISQKTDSSGGDGSSDGSDTPGPPSGDG
jgi:YbbR domain-containing protein